MSSVDAVLLNNRIRKEQSEIITLSVGKVKVKLVPMLN